MESDGQGALIDTGIGASADAIVEAAAGVELRCALLTHAHPDHSGGSAALRRRVPGLEVMASAEVARWVSEGDEEAMSLEAGKRADFYPADYRVEPCPDVRPLDPGERVTVGGLEIEAFATPGHAAGHMAYLAAGACFSGDLVFFGGLISLEANWDCSLPDYAASVRRLAAVEFDALLPGHHSISLRRGRRHVEAAARQFELGFVPRSVV